MSSEATRDEERRAEEEVRRRLLYEVCEVGVWRKIPLDVHIGFVVYM